MKRNILVSWYKTENNTYVIKYAFLTFVIQNKTLLGTGKKMREKEKTDAFKELFVFC